MRSLQHGVRTMPFYELEHNYTYNLSYMCNIKKHYIYLPISYVYLAFYVLIHFILKTVSFGMSGWVCINNESLYLLSASNGLISPACETFPYSQTHIFSPCHSPVCPTNQPPEVLSTWRLTVHACAFRTNSCLDIFPKLKSATCSRDAVVHHKFPRQLFAVSHVWSSSSIWYRPSAITFFSVKAFRTVLLSNFRKKTSNFKKN